MRISDWSSDVCFSDLSPGSPAQDGVDLGLAAHGEPGEAPLAEARVDAFAHGATLVDRLAMGALHAPAPGCHKIGSAPCRASVGQYRLISVVGVSFKKTILHSHLSNHT